MHKKPPPILIFELGNLQVYHFPTPEEITRNLMPYEVYWQDKNSKRSYGPFQGIYHAVAHHVWVLNTQSNKGAKVPGNVVYMDFKTKTRITIG